MIDSSIDALMIGGPKPFRSDGTLSAMAREPVQHPVMLRALGFEGDQVADPAVHGGVDKAVHFYCAEHYPWWSREIGEHPLLRASGAFGENITAGGMTEDLVRIGDRFRMGKALVEISQGRQPCWKLDHRFQTSGIMSAIVTSRRSGFYFRVLEEGLVRPGDAINQVEQAKADWTVDRVFHILTGGGHKAPHAKAALKDLAALDVLAENWRARAAKLAAL